MEVTKKVTMSVDCQTPLSWIGPQQSLRDASRLPSDITKTTGTGTSETAIRSNRKTYPTASENPFNNKSPTRKPDEKLNITRKILQLLINLYLYRTWTKTWIPYTSIDHPGRSLVHAVGRRIFPQFNIANAFRSFLVGSTWRLLWEWSLPNYFTNSWRRSKALDADTALNNNLSIYLATKIFNYKTSLQQIDFQSLSQNPLPWSCSGSEFLYAPCGHIVTGDLDIVRNDKLRDLLRKGPKYVEPVSFSWHQNFDIIMDACEAYARRWAKKEDVELDTLSELIKSIGDVLKRRIRRLKHSINTRHESIFSNPDVVTELSRLHENFVIVPADKASNNYTFVCKRYYVDILIEETLHTILRFFLHQRFKTTINRFSLPLEYKQPMKSSICHTFTGFQRCTKIPINTDSLRVPRSVRPSLYPFYSQNCFHIFSKVFRSTAKHPTPEVGSIRFGS